MNKIEEFRSLRFEIGCKTEELKAMNAKLDDMERDILDHFSVEGISSLKTEDGANFISVTKMYPNISDRERAYEWLKDLGAWDDMATVNTNTFKAFIKDRMAAGEEIPEDCINIYYKDTLTVRNG